MRIFAVLFVVTLSSSAQTGLSAGSVSQVRRTISEHLDGASFVPLAEPDLAPLSLVATDFMTSIKTVLVRGELQDLIPKEFAVQLNTIHQIFDAKEELQVSGYNQIFPEKLELDFGDGDPEPYNYDHQAGDNLTSVGIDSARLREVLATLPYLNAWPGQGKRDLGVVTRTFAGSVNGTHRFVAANVMVLRLTKDQNSGHTTFTIAP